MREKKEKREKEAKRRKKTTEEEIKCKKNKDAKIIKKGKKR